MFLDEPKGTQLKKLPPELQQAAVDFGYEADFDEPIFHVIEDTLYYESDEYGYHLELPNDLEQEHPRFFASQDEGCTDDAIVTGSTLFPIGSEPADYELLCLKYLYPDVSVDDWSEINWANG